MEEKQQPKISLPEIVFITPFFIITDGIGILLAFFGLDDFGLIDIFQFPVSQIYLRMKGVKGTAMLVGNILETFPYVGGLPNETIAWLITVWLDRHPKIAKIAEKAGKAVGATNKTIGLKPATPATSKK